MYGEKETKGDVEGQAKPGADRSVQKDAGGRKGGASESPQPKQALAIKTLEQAIIDAAHEARRAFTKGNAAAFREAIDALHQLLEISIRKTTAPGKS